MTNEEKVQKITELMTAKFPVTVSSLAHAIHGTALEAARLLPEDARSFAPGSEFHSVWTALTEWESATVIIQHKGNVFEVCGKLADGKEARGFFNLMGHKSPLQGHLKSEKVAEIGFITLPFMGRESHFVAFFDEEGDSMYEIYVGRENHQLIESAKESFLMLQKSYRAEACA